MIRVSKGVLWQVEHLSPLQEGRDKICAFSWAIRGREKAPNRTNKIKYMMPLYNHFIILIITYYREIVNNYYLLSAVPAELGDGGFKPFPSGNFRTVFLLEPNSSAVFDDSPAGIADLLS